MKTSVLKHVTDIQEWKKLGEANIFPPESHLELIDGEILEMAPIGFNHAGHVTRLMNVFGPLLADKAIMTAQNPLQLGDLSEPEPDFMLLRPEKVFYTQRHPTAEDVLLLVEVAESSLDYDQTIKLGLYARYNIAEYWVLNLNTGCLEVYRQPQGHLYQQKNTLKVGDTITLSLLDSIEIKVSEIL
jgi:Uma2 family endonuclease